MLNKIVVALCRRSYRCVDSDACVEWESVLSNERRLARSRFNPFIEGLAGVDRTSTRITGNNVIVTGQEFQVAYAAGGGAQIALSRRIAVNFQAQYFATEHSLTYTGWEPSHLQISTGLVFTLFGARESRRVAEESYPAPPALPATLAAPKPEAPKQEPSRRV